MVKPLLTSWLFLKRRSNRKILRDRSFVCSHRNSGRFQDGFSCRPSINFPFLTYCIYSLSKRWQVSIMKMSTTYSVIRHTQNNRKFFWPHFVLMTICFQKLLITVLAFSKQKWKVTQYMDKIQKVMYGQQHAIKVTLFNLLKSSFSGILIDLFLHYKQYWPDRSFIHQLQNSSQSSSIHSVHSKFFNIMPSTCHHSYDLKWINTVM